MTLKSLPSLTRLSCESKSVLTFNIYSGLILILVRKDKTSGGSLVSHSASCLQDLSTRGFVGETAGLVGLYGSLVDLLPLPLRWVWCSPFSTWEDGGGDVLEVLAMGQEREEEVEGWGRLGSETTNTYANTSPVLLKTGFLKNTMFTKFSSTNWRAY